MSGFEILIELVPIARRPTVPVVVLTTLSNFMLSELVEKNGAQVCLHKAITSGDVLSKAVFRAIEAVPRTGKEQREVFDFPRRETTGRKMDQPPTGQ
ncbi:hypothetical protein W02_06030 [Nitrospira sp. KM1]|nr:hypothetical protein W02_06030 [Nitrospira sp. KM1]